MIQVVNLALLGFGSVGRALVELLIQKRAALKAEHGLEWRITALASRRLGCWVTTGGGFDPERLRQGQFVPAERLPTTDVGAWLDASRAGVLIETTTLNPHTGQPAIDHLRMALERHMHAITANKGPVVHAYPDLSALAKAQDRRFLFESSVMDGVPIFGLFRETLPVAELRAFYGILNSTTTVILEAIEKGADWEDGIREAQALGVAEADPSADIDGWDAAVKVTALANVLMGAGLHLDQVSREGIRGLDPAEVRTAHEMGSPYRLVSRIERAEDGSLRASVRPERVTGALAQVQGTSSLIHFETDVLGGLTLIEHHPRPEMTAYGLLSDLVRAVARD